MKIIGITGGVGAGKSQVLEYMNDKYGASICRTDEVAKKLQKKGGVCYAPIVEHFGKDILDDKEELDRERLAAIVFADQKELDVLNAIVHPAVKEEVKHLMRKEERKNTNLFLLESALLIEDNYQEICDELWFVYVNQENRKKRLIFARGYSEQKVEEIFAAQQPKEVYLRHCDRVVDNNGIFAETTLQLDKIVRDL